MSVMLDIIVAGILGAVISLITINANMVLSETWASYNSGVMVQQMLISNAQIIETEFRNMGCGVDNASQSIIEADSTCIEFKMAFEPQLGAAVHNVKYYAGDSTQLMQTDNPHDRFLYRQEDGGTEERIGIVTRFTLAYYNYENDSLDTPVASADLSSIKVVEITMEAQSPFPSIIKDDGQKLFASALWKQTRLASQNLKR